MLHFAGRKAISIHALREEGDMVRYYGLPTERVFLSTPSARRATCAVWQRISGSTEYFYPRPPRGGRRRNRRNVGNANQHFYPRPPRGGRHCFLSFSPDSEKFLSTPSARRATAKTERKPSAFVSLYTSLHKLQRDVCKPNRKITPLLAQTAGILVRSVPENHVCCWFALAGHQKISTLSWANSGCSPTCSTLVW